MRALLLALALAACASPAQQPPGPADGGALVHLVGTEWRRIDDEDASPHNPTLTFDGARVSGYSGCNRWSGSVRQNGEELRFVHVAATEMACAPPAAAAQRNFLSVLERARYAHYDQFVLVLLDAEQNQIARFESDRPR